jgi:hypothetical protein
LRLTASNKDSPFDRNLLRTLDLYFSLPDQKANGRNCGAVAVFRLSASNLSQGPRCQPVDRLSLWPLLLSLMDMASGDVFNEDGAFSIGSVVVAFCCVITRLASTEAVLD